jgi:CheY-like chemotaxis protein
MDNYVLVVDDQPDVRRLIMEVLDTIPAAGREAVNGEQALSIVRESTPRAIVLDLMMPVMNGFTFLTHLHGEKSSKTIPVILLSGVAEDGAQIRTLPGVVGVLKKGSFSIEELRTMLIAILESSTA